MRHSSLLLLALVAMLIQSSQAHVVLGLHSEETVWWDSDWKCRKRLDIVERSGYRLTDFPVEVTFEHGGKAQPDGDDIRVVSDAFEIPSYVSRVNSTHATVIFEIGVSALGTRSIHVYYGNSNAVTPRYDKVPLRISEGQKGYAIIDNRVYIGWDYTSWGWSNDVVLWNDFRIDFDGDGNPANNNDLIKDYETWQGGIGRHYRGTWGAIGLGEYRGYLQTPICIDIKFADVVLRVYRNNPWVETTQADLLSMFSPTYTHANYGGGIEQNIVDGMGISPLPEPGHEPTWNDVYRSRENPRWMAFRDSSSGDVLASTGLRIGDNYAHILSAKEAWAWNRVISYSRHGFEPLEPYDQPDEARIYWYADNANSYSNIEAMARIFNNQPSALVGSEEEFPPLPYVEVDLASVSDDRVDVGTSQTIGFHARWSHNQSDMVGGTIYVNGTRYLTDERGWVTFSCASQSVGKKTWTITGVDVNGVTPYRQTVNNPSVIWDRVNIVVAVSSSRVAIGSSVNMTWSGVYEYDGSPFDGVAFSNDTLTKPAVGRYGYTIASIADPLYGLTAFRANEVYCIFDRIRAETEVETLTPGTIHVAVGLSFECDGSPVEDAVVKVNEGIARKQGNGIYAASLPSWMPFLEIDTRVERVGFDPIVTGTTAYALGNILSYSSLIVAVSVSALKLNRRKARRKKRLASLRQLEDLVVRNGRIGLKQVSEAIGVDVASVKALLSDLID